VEILSHCKNAVCGATGAAPVGQPDRVEKSTGGPGSALSSVPARVERYSSNRRVTGDGQTDRIGFQRPRGTIRRVHVEKTDSSRRVEEDLDTKKNTTRSPLACTNPRPNVYKLFVRVEGLLFDTPRMNPFFDMHAPNVPRRAWKPIRSGPSPSRRLLLYRLNASGNAGQALPGPPVRFFQPVPACPTGAASCGATYRIFT